MKYRCNLDESIHLKNEIEARDYYWVKLSRHKYNAKTFVTTHSSRVNPMCPEEFKQFLKVINDQHLDTPEDLRAVLNWDEWRVVHNPTLIKDIETLKIK